MKEGPYGARAAHEPSRMRLHGYVFVDDVLQALVAKCGRIASNALKNEFKGTDYSEQDAVSEDGGAFPRKCKTTADPWGAIDAAEFAIGREMGVIRCLADLEQSRHMTTRRTFAFLEIYSRAPHRASGELILSCLRAYHEWAHHSQERALAEVFAWSQRLIGISVDALELAQHFRQGKCSKHRKQAANYYADALMTLGEFVRIWNRKSLRSHNTG